MLHSTLEDHEQFFQGNRAQGRRELDGLIGEHKLLHRARAIFYGSR